MCNSRKDEALLGSFAHYESLVLVSIKGRRLMADAKEYDGAFSPLGVGAGGTFEQEILRAERQRMKIIGAFFAMMFFAATLVRLVWAEGFSALLEKPAPFNLMMLISLGYTCYEFSIRRLLGHFLETGRTPPWQARYFNAFVETSLPTLILFGVCDYLTPSYAVLTPSLLIYFILIALSALRLDFALSVFSGLTAAAGYLVVCYWKVFPSIDPSLPAVLQSHLPHWMRALLLLLTGGLTGLVGMQIRGRIIATLDAVEQRNHVKTIFGQHVSPQVVEELLGHKSKLVSAERKVCIMFLDIRNFTTFCEGKTPEEVVEHLNRLFGFMVESVNGHQGVINKFLGDGFMAIFGAPLEDAEASLNAVRASIEIVKTLDAERNAGRVGDSRIGIGLHTGEVMTGNVGSLLRKEYTVIGDAVNLASRIESTTKAVGTQILISESVYNDIGEASEQFESIGPVQVKGRNEPVNLYKVS
jgi:adenylate cyclase